MKVAFIGLGNMGSGIAHCVLKGGFDLTVWNRTASKMEPLVAEGARSAGSAREAVTDADVVITSLMDDQSLIDTVQAANGILAGMKKGAVHVCVTTISPECADRLEELHRKHGSHYVSAPVVGRPEAAATGQLLAYLAGEPSAIELATPVCRSFTQNITVISDRPSVANCLKLCINFSGVAFMEVMGEAYVLAEKCGLPLQYLFDFYQQRIFNHPGLKMYAEKIKSRDFAGRGGFVMSGGLKDVQLMLATAKRVGTSLEVGAVVERKLKAAIAAGMQEADWSAFYEVTRREAGLN